MRSNEPILDIRGIYANYGQVPILRDITMTVHRGEIVTLIGANGAGKSSLLKVISGLLPPRRGEVVFDGRNVAGRPPEEIVGLGMGHVPERRHVFGALSVLDNLQLGAYQRYRREPRKVIAQDLEAMFALFPALRERRHQSAGTLSGGEQQMVALGRGLMARPKLLLLDEPSLGLAPTIAGQIMRVIAGLRDRGVSVLLCEQNIRAALMIADRAYVMETGRISSEGSADTLLRDEQVRAAYLGKGGSRCRHPAARPPAEEARS